jgi:hypothetical protein
MTGVARKLLAGGLVAAVAIGTVLAGAELARGAEFRVSACGSAGEYQNHLLAASTSNSRMSAYTACPTDGNGHFVGVAALAGIDRGPVPVFANAIQSFTAPTGTTIRRVHIKAEGRAWNGDWTSLLQASTDRFASNAWTLSGCSGNAGSVDGCVSALGNLDQNYEIPGATGIRSVVSCGNFNGCTTHSTGYWPYTRSFYFIHEFDVTLDDTSDPIVSAAGGGLASGQWLRGTQSLSFTATDNSGIRRTRFWVDDLGTLADEIRDCDYTYAVPCSDVSAGEYSLDTTRLGDGVHYVAADALDATDSNWSNTVQAVRVDNHAPAEPGAAFVVGGEAWRKTNGFAVRWTNPDSAAPITRAYYDLCKPDGSSCSTGSETDASGISQLPNIRVPQPGDYTIRVWLADEAGNVSDAKSAPLHLRFDNVAPAQAAPQHRNGWVDKSHAKQLDQQIDPPKAGTPPVSGIAGYAVTTDGSTPGSTVDVAASAAPDYIGHKLLHDLPEGTTTVRARAISGAGVASPDVGSTEIYGDVTPPKLTVEGRPDSNQWIRTPVMLRLIASEPGQLSGMAGGPLDQPSTFGGYITVAVDGGQQQEARGPQRTVRPDGRLGYAPASTADVQVGNDGAHAITFQAHDVAGNATAENSLTFKIDQTPPELAVFEAQQPSDPRLITVVAADRTSGLADGGKIELRRIAPTPGDSITLRTTREGDRYSAHIHNATLPEGDYQFIVTVPDQAGNEAIGTTDRDGREEILHITPTQVGPYRTGAAGEPALPSGGPDAQDAAATVDTRLSAGAVSKVTTRKCTRAKNRGRRKRCSRPTTSNSVVHELRVGFGRAARVNGALTTAGGRPIPNVEVTVLARPAMTGADYAAEGSVRTDATGTFTYQAPAGPGRTLDFHYRGDRHYKHADDQVTLRVPAFATIGANKRSVRNGRVVQFTGTLPGRPYPGRGKLLDLQAYYRNKWRTFATPRVTLNGKWKYRYRFQATRGVVLYKFRILVRASSDYPYEPGYSKVTKVRVTGA